MKFSLHDTEVKFAEGALERFKEVAGKRAMICPNHSCRHDPQVMFAVSKYLGEDFNFVAAREVFDWDNGLNGWWLQHLGAFSVVRGAADRESFKTSKRILVEGKKKLVLFPEGEISRQNDTLMPLESGATQFCFWAIEELTKKSANNGGTMEPLYVIPFALRYTYASDVRPRLMETLADLEANLGIKSSHEQSAYVRLRAVSEGLLNALEQEYNVKAAPESTLNERVVALRGEILKSVAMQLHLTLPPNESQLNWVRILRNSMDDFIYADDSPMSDYQKKMHEEKALMVKRFYSDLDRVVNFIAIYEGYFKENNTQERFSEILDRLESEIRGGEPSLKGPRVVYVDIGKPINMTELFPEYKTKKKSVLSTVTENIGSQITSMLKGLDQERKHLLVE
jgi:1-acyl-sn-glycerol-3-phosphate acyltransferase